MVVDRVSRGARKDNAPIMSQQDRSSASTDAPLSWGKVGPAPRARDLTGASLGDFQVDRLLGRGGMGEVYLARQISLNREVALKVLRPDLTNPTYLRPLRGRGVVGGQAQSPEHRPHLHAWQLRRTPVHRDGVCPGDEPARVSAQERDA